MSFKYTKLWVMLAEQELNKTFLRENGVHPTTIAKMGRNEIVSMETIEELCKLLNCQPGDIMEYVEDEAEGGE